MRPQSCGNKQRLVSIKADKETQFSNMESQVEGREEVRERRRKLEMLEY